MVSHAVYFKGMMFFTLTSQMYHRISVLVPVLVRVPEYLSTSTSTSTSTMTLELTSTSTRNSVLKYCEYEYWVRVPQPWYTDMIDICTYGRTNGRKCDSLGMHRIVPVYCVPRHEFRATCYILQPFLTCWLLQNLTWCTLHPHILA